MSLFWIKMVKHRRVNRYRQWGIGYHLWVKQSQEEIHSSTVLVCHYAITQYTSVTETVWLRFQWVLYRLNVSWLVFSPVIMLIIGWLPLVMCYVGFGWHEFPPWTVWIYRVLESLLLLDGVVGRSCSLLIRVVFVFLESCLLVLSINVVILVFCKFIYNLFTYMFVFQKK